MTRKPLDYRSFKTCLLAKSPGLRPTVKHPENYPLHDCTSPSKLKILAPQICNTKTPLLNLQALGGLYLEIALKYKKTDKAKTVQQHIIFFICQRTITCAKVIAVKKCYSLLLFA